MCFFIHSKHPGEKITKQDITCYKTFDSDARSQNQYGKYVRSMHRSFNYKIGVLYELDGYMNVIYNWFWNRKVIDVGLHSHTNLNSAKIDALNDGLIYECIIPKGSRYYYNPQTEEYVSDQIIIKKLVTRIS